MCCKVCGVRRASKLCVIPQKRARRRQKRARRSRRRLHVVAHASRHVRSPGLLGFVRFSILQILDFALCVVFVFCNSFPISQVPTQNAPNSLRQPNRASTHIYTMVHIVYIHQRPQYSGTRGLVATVSDRPKGIPMEASSQLYLLDLLGQAL